MEKNRFSEADYHNWLDVWRNEIRSTYMSLDMLGAGQSSNSGSVLV
jgi:hypothetical protein